MTTSNEVEWHGTSWTVSPELKNIKIRFSPFFYLHLQVYIFHLYEGSPHFITTMSLEQVPVSLPFVGGKKATLQHPLGPLTASEISETARLIKSVWPSNTNIQFKSITLQEPNKSELVPFLQAEYAGQSTPTIERRSFVVYYIRNTVSENNGLGRIKKEKVLTTSQDKLHEAIINLSHGKVESNVRLGPNVHSNADGGEILAVEKIALEDPQVKAEIAKLQLPEGTVVISDPWIYGSFSQFSNRLPLLTF